MLFDDASQTQHLLGKLKMLLLLLPLQLLVSNIPSRHLLGKFEMRLLLLSLQLLIRNVSPHHLVESLHMRCFGGLKLLPHLKHLMVIDLLLDISLRYPLLL